MRYSEITNEARRNKEHPSQKRTSNFEKLKKYWDSDWLKDNYSAYPENVYISFTQVNKIGINPKSRYNTPIGIYCYPLYEFSSSFEKFNKIIVPFAGEQPFINVLILEKNIKQLNFDIYDETDYSNDVLTLREHFTKKHGDDREFEFIVSSAAEHGTDWGRNIWNITRLLSKDMTEKELRIRKTKVKAKPDSVLWNYLLRVVLGYDLVYDSGHSIIHENEPIQAVFLSKNAFKLAEVIDNKDSHSGLLNNIKRGKESIEKLDKNVVHRFVENNYRNLFSGYFPIEYFEFPSDIILKLIKSDAEWITTIKTVTDGKLEPIEDELLSGDLKYNLNSYDYGQDSNADMQYIAIFYFAEKIKKSRIKKFEELLLKSDKPNIVFQYIRRVIRGPWPEAEHILKNELYINYMKTYKPNEYNELSKLKKKYSIGSKFKTKNGMTVTIVRNTDIDRLLVNREDGGMGTISYKHLVEI